MAYRTPLETRLAKKTTKAIIDFDLIEDGDRVMVGLSGGKDSWALHPDPRRAAAARADHVLARRRQRRLRLRGLSAPGGRRGLRARAGGSFTASTRRSAQVIDDKLDADETPCSLCARLRRGVLYRLARQVGATKIALGHHLDDFVETLLLNLFFAGALKAMPARLVSDNRAHVVIRPLVYVTEAEARAYARENDLPVIGCCCPACGDLSLQRQRVKRLIMELEREHPNVKASMMKALGNVMPRHLLDRRLNPVRDLEQTRVAHSTSRRRSGDVAAATLPLIPLADRHRHVRRRRRVTLGLRCEPSSSACGRAVTVDDRVVGADRPRPARARRRRGGRRPRRRRSTSPRRSASCASSTTTATPPAASG